MPTPNPFESDEAERLALSRLFREARMTVWSTPLGEFKRSPLAARLRLALSTEAAEVQERGVATPNAAADDPASLPLAGGALQDVDGQGRGTLLDSEA